MVIVQIAQKTPTPVEYIQTNDLKPYESNTQNPYITAYFKADVLPKSKFVIGDGKEYNNFKAEKYINQPLEPNSSYTVFLRFFETMVNSISNLYCRHFNIFSNDRNTSFTLNKRLLN